MASPLPCDSLIVMERIKDICTSRTGSRGLLVALITLACLAIGHGYMLQQKTDLLLVVESEHIEVIQIFWKNSDQSYSLERSVRAGIFPNKNVYRFTLPSYARYDSLRIDPFDRSSHYSLRSLEYRIAGKPVLLLDTGDALQRHLEEKSGAYLEKKPSGEGLLIGSTGNDPQLILSVKTIPLFRKGYAGVLLCVLGVALITAFLLLSVLRSHRYEYFKNGTIKRRLQVGALLASCFLTVVIPVALPEEHRLFVWLGYVVLLTAWLYGLSAYLIARPVPVKQPMSGGRRFSWLIYSVPGLLVFTVYLLAFWPASMSPDSLDQWGQLLRLKFKDWHPVFHTLNIWAVTRFWLSPAAGAVFQVIVLACSFGWALSRLARAGVTRPVLWVTSIFFALLPVNGLMAVTIWKDIPYSAAMMILSILLLEIAISSGKWLESRKNAALMILVILFISLYRHNGIFPAFATPVALLFAFPTRWKNLTVILLIALGSHFFVRGPVYGWLDVERDNPLDYIVEKLEKRVLKKVDSFFSQSDVQPDKKGPTVTSKKPKQHRPKFTLTEVVLFRLDSSSLLWRIKPLDGHYRRVDYVNLWGVARQDEFKIRYITGNKYDLHESPKVPVLTEWIYSLFERSKDDPYLFWMWRPAVYLYFLMFSLFIFSARHPYKIWFVIVPVVFNSAPVLFFASRSSIFRYHYSILLTAVVLTLPLLLSTLSHPKERLR
ncbi:hypothetical protein SAMN02745124_02303 [Desulfofustis glycolicus DSM 9705]|uniref:Uncharacterized protein n=2 Tax=Desulfofustis glycolicus TaxID=51195 RepID=A0A1M5WI24_9BACT|nr:hypothetical protein SAMN02745124_02303 [Desulfofustis glycolicus DSM 9705]